MQQTQPGYPAASQPAAQQPLRVAERGPEMGSAASFMAAANPNEHPLMACLRWAREGSKNIERIQDYSATMIKRERIKGAVGEHEYMFVKIRHRPFSVYGYFVGPESMKGQEVIYVAGKNDGKMWAHGTGMKKTMFGTVSLPPDGFIAMQGQRYPITEIGVLNLTRRMIEIGEHDSQFGECEVNCYPGVKIDGRSCTCIQVKHPVPRRDFLFHLARIFVDDELNVPIRYASWSWPKQPGGTPELLEEYTYVNLRLNNGFTDADFDIRNPNYQF